MNCVLKAAAFLTPFVLLIGCSVTPPQPHIFNNTRTYDQSFDETWDHLINYLQKEEFRIHDADKAKTDNEGKTRGEIDATTSHYSADIADCGSYMWFDRMLALEDFIGNIYAYVVPEGGKTMVTIQTGFLVVNLRGDRSGVCTSTGALEQRILNSS